jgi:hypothetical protein
MISQHGLNSEHGETAPDLEYLVTEPLPDRSKQKGSGLVSQSLSVGGRGSDPIPAGLVIRQFPLLNCEMEIQPGQARINVAA